MTSTSKITGGQLLTRTLVEGGVDRVFCVPGESYLAALDALYETPEIDVVQCRHEAGAGLMAVADARLTGRPAICFVSRGPGAGNATLAIHVAGQDAVPVIFLIGQVERANLGRGAFQEVDYVKTYCDMAKWVVEVHDPARLSEYVARAFHEATSGTPGPVVLSLPEDMLEEPTDAPVVAPRTAGMVSPSAQSVGELAALISKAERPIVLAGGDCEPAQARAALLAFAERWNIPIACTNKHQAIFPNGHPNWIGHIGYLVPPALRQTLEKSDLIIAIGTRLGDVSTQRYTFPSAPIPRQPVVHVYPDPAIIRRNHEVRLGIVANAAPVLQALNALDPQIPAGRDAWCGELRGVRDKLAAYCPANLSDGVDFGGVAQSVARQLDDDAIVTLDAGNFVSWVHGLISFKSTQQVIGAVGGAMGLAVPAAVAASIRFPGRQVLSFVGDGGFLMTGYELATAMQKGARPKIIVSNNKSYGVIRGHQEAAYPGRVIATDLANPDFAALARSFGAAGYVIDNADDIDQVIANALAEDNAAIIDVRASLERLNMYRSLADFARR